MHFRSRDDGCLLLTIQGAQRLSAFERVHITDIRCFCMFSIEIESLETESNTTQFLVLIAPLVVSDSLARASKCAPPAV